MKLSLLFTTIIFIFFGYADLDKPDGESIKVSSNEGKNSLVFKCSYPTKYYQEVLKDIQSYDSQFTPMEKTYNLGDGNATISFKSKGKLIISYQASDKDYLKEKDNLKDLTQQIGETLGQKE